MVKEGETGFHDVTMFTFGGTYMFGCIGRGSEIDRKSVV